MSKSGASQISVITRTSEPAKTVSSGNASSPAVVMVKTENLSKVYKSRAGRVVVFEGLDFRVSKGELVGIIGPSGAGKSTLLHLLGGLDRPTAGTVKIGEFDIYKLGDVDLARFRNREVGFIFQLHHLLPEFTALENIMMPLLVRRVARAEAVRLAQSAISSVGLSERATHRPGELSGGEQARVAIARALVAGPRLLLGDEPTGDLDGRTSESIHDLLKEQHLTRKLTSIVVTHNERLASVCDRVLHLENGRLVESVRV